MISAKVSVVTCKDYRRTKVLEHIRHCWETLISLPDFTISSYGPLDPNDQGAGARTGLMTGVQLKRASTNPEQGLWLSKLAVYVGNESNCAINVLELGTAAGISGMYLLAGMAMGKGGHLASFEGSIELAEIADNFIPELIRMYKMKGVDYEIIVGNFDETLEPYLGRMTKPIHLAFVDGNHREEATLRYHKLVRTRMDVRGVIVHDDIGWSDGMMRAWRRIQEDEGVGRTVELYLGGRPSRGIVFLGADPNAEAEHLHLDGVLERLGRRLRRAISGSWAA